MHMWVIEITEEDKILFYNGMNDKEKNKKAIDLIDELIGRYKIIEGVMMTSDQPDKVTVTKQTIYDL